MFLVFTVITAEPIFLPVTTPDEFTVATSGSLVEYTTLLFDAQVGITTGLSETD